MDYCYHRFEKKNNEKNNEINNKCNKNESNSENNENNEIMNELHVQYGENYKGYDYNIYLKRGKINCRFKENTKIILLSPTTIQQSSQISPLATIPKQQKSPSRTAKA